MTKRLVWADNILCTQERPVDSDVREREGNVSLGELSIVTRAFGSLGSDFTRDGRTSSMTRNV